MVQELLREDKTIAQISAEYEEHATQLNKWKSTALQGLRSLSEIARRFHMDRMTMQKFAYADTYPETAAYRLRASMLHPYEVYLRERWQQGCCNASRLHREIVAMGLCGQTQAGGPFGLASAHTTERRGR